MKTSTAVLTVALTALFARILFVWVFGIPPALLDAHEYRVMAENLLAGRNLNTTPEGEADLPIRVPLYAFFVAGLFAVFGVSTKPVVAAHIIASAMLAVLVFLIGRKCFKDDRVALVGALLLAIHLPSMVHCGVLYPDTLFAFLLGCASLATLTLFRRPSVKWALGCGLLLGISTLTKAAGQGLIALLLVFLLFALKAPFRRRLALSAVALAAFLLVMGPWAIRNWSRYGTFLPTGTLAGFNFLTGNYEELVPPKGTIRAALSPEVFQRAEKMSWIEKDKYFFEEGKKVFRKNLRNLPKRALLKTSIVFIDYPRLSLLDNIAYDSVIGPRRGAVLVWTSVAQNVTYILLALLAVFFCKGSDRKLLVMTVFMLLYFWLGYVLTRALSRYSISLYPYICLFSGCTLWTMIKGKMTGREPPSR